MALILRNHSFRSLNHIPSSKSSLTSSLLKLPPALRIRSFHATPRSQIYDGLLSSSQYLLETVHTVSHLPWAWSLPLSALLIRTTLVLPLAIHVRRCTQKQVSLFPLITSWRSPLRKETMAEVGHLGPTAAQARLLKKMRKKRNEIYKRWGCQNWKVIGLPLLQLPVFLVAIEGVRKMCGSTQGLLGMVSTSVGGWFSGSGSSEAAQVNGDATSSTGSILPQVFQADPTLATEGALWFPNLLVADPQLYLPFMLSGAILLNLFGKLPQGTKVVRQAQWQIRMKRSLGVVALCVAPLTLHVPSAMLVYWISSTTLAYLQAVGLDFFMPIEKPILPCEPKRPLSFGDERVPAQGKL